MANPRGLFRTALSPRQDRFIAELLDTSSIREACARLKVHPATASRWMQDSEFREALSTAKAGALQEAALTLQTAVGKATKKLVKFLEGEDADASLEAARIISSNAIRLFEIQAASADVRELREQVKRLLEEQARLNMDKRREALRAIQGGRSEGDE